VRDANGRPLRDIQESLMIEKRRGRAADA